MPGRVPRYGDASGRLGDHANELAARVATLTGELHEFGDSVSQLTLLRRADDFDSTARSHFEQAFIPERTQRSQHGVGVHTHHGSQMAGRRQPIAGLCVALCDRPAYLGGDLAWFGVGWSAWLRPQ